VAQTVGNPFKMEFSKITNLVSENNDSPIKKD
jgi:hypothetical protein